MPLGVGDGIAAQPTSMDALGSGQPGAGADQQRAQLQAFMGQLRELDQHIQQVFGQMPSLAPVAKQMQQLIKKAVQESVKTAPPQTGSSEALPSAGQ